MNTNRYIYKRSVSTVTALTTLGTLFLAMPRIAPAQNEVPAAPAAPVTTAPATAVPAPAPAAPVVFGGAITPLAPGTPVAGGATAITTSAATSTTEVTTAPAGKLYVELKDSSLGDALEMIFKSAGVASSIIDESAHAVNIESMTFTNAPWDSVVRQLANQYGFRVRRNDAGAYIVEPRPDLTQNGVGGYPGSGGGYSGSGGGYPGGSSSMGGYPGSTSGYPGSGSGSGGYPGMGGRGSSLGINAMRGGYPGSGSGGYPGGSSSMGGYPGSGSGGYPGSGRRPRRNNTQTQTTQ